MFLGKLKITHSTSTLLLDVRNAYIQASILVNKKEALNVLTSKRYPIKESESLIQPDKFSAHLEYTLTDFMQNTFPELISVEKVKINDIAIVFSSPWYEPQMKHIQFKKDEPVIFTKELYESLLEKEPALKNKKSDTPNLEQNITHILLNNYELSDPFGKPTTSIDIAFYISNLDAGIEKITREKVSAHFPKPKLKIYSSGFVTFQSLRNTFVNLSSFTFFDISADVTEIGIVKNNTFDTLVTIPLGKKHLMESIAKECKLSGVSLSSSLSMLARGELDHQCSISMFEIAQKEGVKWASELGKVVTKLGEGESLPHKLFLFSDQDIGSFAQMLLKSEPIQKNIFNTNSTDVIILDNKNINSQIKTNHNLNITIDSLLLSKALFIRSVEK